MKQFKPGDQWSKDFDYKGMLKHALSITNKTSVKELEL